jgi:uracil-DNA glycosylase
VEEAFTLGLDGWRETVPLLRDGYLEGVLGRVGERRERETVYPPEERVLYALEATPFDAVKVVILGQDPYHGAGQANGLAFSVFEDTTPPPSLRNILREVRDDIYGGAEVALSPDLTRWAEQGVLLLNATLTVAAGRPKSHAGLGWESLTDAVVRALSARRAGLAFLLWGNPARAKKELVDEGRHLVLEAPHPSPLSAWRGFFGCRHFSKANVYLEERGVDPIEW